MIELFWCAIASIKTHKDCLQFSLRIIENNRIVHVGRDSQGSSGPSPCSSEGNLEVNCMTKCILQMLPQLWNVWFSTMYHKMVYVLKIRNVLDSAYHYSSGENTLQNWQGQSQGQWKVLTQFISGKYSTGFGCWIQFCCWKLRVILPQ